MSKHKYAELQDQVLSSVKVWATLKGCIVSQVKVKY